jgi:hypothetical protein
VGKEGASSEVVYPFAFIVSGVILKSKKGGSNGGAGSQEMYVTRMALGVDSDEHAADHAMAAQWAPRTTTIGDARREAAMGHESLTWVVVVLGLALTFIIIFVFYGWRHQTLLRYTALLLGGVPGRCQLCGCGNLRRGRGESHHAQEGRRLS